jgi:hypothetical protein
MNHRVTFLLLSLSLMRSASGCRESTASAPPASSANALTVPSAAVAAAPRLAAEVARVIFVDKEHACKCTQKRVDDGWAALEAALAEKQSATVERFHADTQPEAVEAYNELRAMMALPALYFVDAKGSLIELLQGEVTKEQIRAVLGTGPSGR